MDNPSQAAVADFDTSLHVIPPPAMSLVRYMILVGIGLLVTTLGQLKVIGLLPLTFFLKEQLHFPASEVATWSFWALLPWSLKPIAGLITDALPICGTRRRYYLLIPATVAAWMWWAMAMVAPTFNALLVVAFIFNTMAVMASVATGGLLVEGAQGHGATGRLSSLRLIIINLSMIAAGLAGGYLADKWFNWTAFSGALLFASMVPATIILLREAPLPPNRPHALRNTWTQLTAVFRCKTLWIAAGLFLLVQISPGFSTPLLYFQSDTLKFSKQFIGMLMLLSGIVGVLASFIYPLVCGRLRLRILLYFAIVISTLTTLAYLGYVSWKLAMVIEACGGFGITLAQLPLFDLAARATPKGSEAVGYSVMIAFWNIGLQLSDVIGSHMFDGKVELLGVKYVFHKFQFTELVWVNAGTTALVLVVIPFLPGYLVDRKEGETAAT